MDVDASLATFLFDNGTLAETRFYFFQLGILNSMAFGLLYLASVRLGALKFVAAGLILLLSINQIPAEQNSTHYDWPYLFFVSLFLYSVVTFIGQQSLGRALACGIAGALLVLQSTVSSITVPTLLFGCTTIFVSFRPFTRWVTLASTLLAPPVATATVITLSVFFQFGTFAPATAGGSANMLFVMNMYNWDALRVRGAVKRHNMPAWYQWCYDNTEASYIKSRGVWGYMMGRCGKSVEHGQPGWPIDFSELRKKLIELNEAELVKRVDADSDMMRNGVQAFKVCGYRCTQWHEVYQRANVQFARKVFWENPLEWLNQARLIHQGEWKVTGPKWSRLWHERYTKQVLTPTGEQFFHLSSLLFEQIIGFAYRVIPLLLIFVFLGFLGSYCVKKRVERNGRWMRISNSQIMQFCSRMRPNIERTIALLITVIPIYMITAFFVGLSGAEHARYYWHILPMLIILASVFGSTIILWIYGLFRSN